MAKYLQIISQTDPVLFKKLSQVVFMKKLFLLKIWRPILICLGSHSLRYKRLGP